MNPPDSEMTKSAKHMSYILRHNPDEVEGLDEKGRTTLTKISRALELSAKEVIHLIESDEKSRFGFDGHNVWAVQGHSIPNLRMDDELLTDVPQFFYHGTKARSLNSIMDKGLIPNGRNMVHLSTDITTALSVANRRSGNSVLLSIDAPAMIAEEFKFFRAKNGVILIEHVPVRFLKAFMHYPN